jgi:hypothetical protein
VAHMTVDCAYRKPKTRSNNASNPGSTLENCVKGSGQPQGPRVRARDGAVHVVFREPAHKRDAAERMREREERARMPDGRDNTGQLLGDPPAWRSALVQR